MVGLFALAALAAVAMVADDFSKVGTDGISYRAQQDDESLFEHAIFAIASWAQQQRIVERVYVFGSRARDDYRPESDLDVAVQLIFPEVDTALAHWSFEVDAWVSQLSALLPWAIDLQLLAPDGTPTISAGVKTSSVLVYARQAQPIIPLDL